MVFKGSLKHMMLAAAFVPVSVLCLCMWVYTLIHIYTCTQKGIYNILLILKGKCDSKESMDHRITGINDISVSCRRRIIYITFTHSSNLEFLLSI
jgi:hypothetical protein